MEKPKEFNVMNKISRDGWTSIDGGYSFSPRTGNGNQLILMEALQYGRDNLSMSYSKCYLPRDASTNGGERQKPRSKLTQTS